ncbi:MAG: hypothetical protein JWP29_3493 [Rhodoferax sp.]|nr:hypothetical protein [Rhodoferax sp.]
MRETKNFGALGWRTLALAATLAVTAASASAATVAITPGDPTWSSIPGENNAGSSTAITGAAPISGNGSLELTGDRTRFSMGNYYNPASNLGLLDQVSQLTYSWMVAVNSSNPYNVDYTPALRLHIFDNGVRSELIWEGAYNNVYGNMVKGDLYSSGIADNFYRNVSGSGVTLSNGSQVNHTIFDWASGASDAGVQWYSSSAYVSAISVGDGSGASGAYHAFVDDVTFGINNSLTTFNFEVTASAVPEPASIALLGLGLFGIAATRKRKSA